MFFLWINAIGFSQNPIIKDQGVSDPHIRVFNDTIYLYSGHDSHPSDKTWKMKDWRVFSSTDLLNWKIRDTISPKENYMANDSEDCWAGDAISRNGKYYFYFSDRKRGVGVMTSDSPVGPFIDPLNKPLVSPMHDPTILVDDDANKTHYLVYGDKENQNGFHIAKLNDDMISLAEQPKLIKINGKEWENAPRWMDKNYIFKHNNTYYLSWGRDYAISDNAYGPYNSVGSVGVGHNLNEFAHGSFFKWKGQFYHIWCYYIKKGFKYRTSIISYCHMDDNGKIVTDTQFLDEHFANGVGQYNASWDKIEAEWFYEISGNIKKKGTKEKGFVLSNIKNRNWIKFANVTFDKDFSKIIVKAKLKGNHGAIELRSSSPTGKILGKIKITSSINFKEFTTNIKIPKGKQDIYFVFKSKNGSSLEIDWLKFE
ncbi:family 43 glycosylhydrolase [Polaribacter aestuariivivens]|uniref:family 43 glycosylhydrolase n=1 Tax=Polaribacter aestuariivivens TaxID=2304626 RepID=UPI003F4931E3